jgi:HSP20 family molecular chaperone IbpA
VAKKSLTINGVKREDDLLVEAGSKVKRKERPAGPFVRKFRLPASADLDRAYSSHR